MENELQQPLTDIIAEVTRRSGSELIYFFVIILIGVILILIPFYRLYSNNKNEKQKLLARQEKNREARYAEERRELVTVITANTNAMNELTCVIGVLSKNSENSFKVFDKRLKDMSKNYTDYRTA